MARFVYNFLFFIFRSPPVSLNSFRAKCCTMCVRAHNLLRLHSAQFINRHRSSLSLSEKLWLRATKSSPAKLNACSHKKCIYQRTAAEIPSNRRRKKNEIENISILNETKKKKHRKRTINSTRFTVRFTRQPKYARQKARNTKNSSRTKYAKRKRFVCYRRVYLRI